MGIEIGARYAGDGICEFIVWAPQAHEVAVKIVTPEIRMIPMERDELGYWRAKVDEITPHTQYLYRINNDEERPDPVSHFQPLGVHGPSAAVAHDEFAWSDHAWTGVSQERLVIYELHTGVFTPEGTFDAIIPRLPELRALGVTAIELMPIAEFPGERNWGYDGVYPFSAHHAYGGPAGLKRLVNACHEAGLAVLLSPFAPLLFMGEEYAEEAPFLYFVSHGDADLVRAVRERGGRRNSKLFSGRANRPIRR